MGKDERKFIELSVRIATRGRGQLKTCLGKKSFLTRKLAKSWVNHWERDNYEKVTIMAVDGNHLLPYRCDICEKFHLTKKKIKNSDL